LVILAGPGGFGATRLELELGPMPNRHPGVGGVWLVELAPRSDVAAAVAHTLGISSRAGAALTDALRGSVADRDMLPVLDSCEQGLDAWAELAAFLRRAVAEAPHTVLDLDGEAEAAEEPFAPEAMGRAIPSRRRSLGEGLRIAAQDERSVMAARPR
jgi:predicted ATPase